MNQYQPSDTIKRTTLVFRVTNILNMKKVNFAKKSGAKVFIMQEQVNLSGRWV